MILKILRTIFKEFLYFGIDILKLVLYNKNGVMKHRYELGAENYGETN